MAALPQCERISSGAATASRIGLGPDLAIVHSLLADASAFEPVLPWLSERFRVTLVNLPGFHGSAPVKAGIENYAGWLVEACEGLGVAPGATVIANGFGGTVVLALAAKKDGWLGKLILSDVAAGFPPEGRKAFEVMATKVENEGMASVATIAANRVFHPAYLAAHPEAVEERRQVLLGVQQEAFIAACKTLLTVDLTPELAKIVNAALVVCGELDAATPPSLCQALAKALPQGRYVEISQCGHCPPLEQPQAFISVISEFLGA
ncbi:MAG TPA: alpha/beta fold hydrolase [Hyphomicrobiales bacterium]|nr:alpha/beta fold hydrolase [Hyphomicrobiales bacterium]